MKDWNIKEDKAQNAIYLKEDNGGKGRFFRARFLQPGLVKYSFGVCLLTKEVIDKFVYKFVGCPVVIDHKDVTDESAKDMRVGVISKVDFDPFDAWYWCEGVIFDQEAIDLVNNGYNVSCQYEITQYATNDKEELHNGNPYDKEILDGAPEHLAIVKNPRYENAMIAVNAIDVTAKNWNEQEHPRDEQGKFTNKENGNSNYKNSLLKEYKIVKEDIRKEILGKVDRVEKILQLAKENPNEARFHIKLAEDIHKEIEGLEEQYKYVLEQLQEVLKMSDKAEEKESEVETAQNSKDFVANFKDTLYTVLAEEITNRLGE